MKKISLVVICLVIVCAIAGCASQSAESNIPVLTGEWKQTNSNSDTSYQAATITDNTIEVYWVSDNGETKSLYWAGTFTDPTTPMESFSWESANDHEKTGNALLASSNDTKTFAYEDGVISYEVTAMGTTTTVKLERLK